jgi:uncharacterized protein YjiS (DUF1127 family)
MENIDNATKLSSITQPRLRGIGIRAVMAFVRRAMKAARSRQELVGMDDRMRADIGISWGEALFESKRAPWDLEAPTDPSRRSRTLGG